MKTEVKINIIGIVLILIFLFLLGYTTRSGKEFKLRIAEKEAKIAELNSGIYDMGMDIIAYQDTVSDLKNITVVNHIVIAEKDKRIKSLRWKLNNIDESDTIPTNGKYDVLQLWVGIDTFPKTYPFSARQIDTLYKDKKMFSLAMEAVEVYDEYVKVLTENLQTEQTIYTIQEAIISKQEEQLTAKDDIITLKDSELKLMKKSKRRGKVLTWVFGCIATGLTVIAIAK